MRDLVQKIECYQGKQQAVKGVCVCVRVEGGGRDNTEVKHL